MTVLAYALRSCAFGGPVVFGRRPAPIVAWGNALGARCRPVYLAEGHTHLALRSTVNWPSAKQRMLARVPRALPQATVNVAFGQNSGPQNAQLQNSQARKSRDSLARASG